MTRRAIPSGTSITMPDWNEEGLVLSVRPHGENSALVTLLTAGQGRHAGLVRGASSAKMRGVLQPGNLVRAAWRARLSEQLGQFNAECVPLGSGPADDYYQLRPYAEEVLDS